MTVDNDAISCETNINMSPVSVATNNGTVVNLPGLHDKDGWSFGIYNFAGPGWNSSEGGPSARPVDRVDFAAKIHDFSYAIHNLEFKTEGEHKRDIEQGRGDPIKRSLQHKADLIFRVMVTHTDCYGLAMMYSRINFIHEQTSWARTDDNFVNIFNEKNITTKLNEYRMMPWTDIDESSKTYRPRRPGSRRDRGEIARRPQYDTLVPEDATWLRWAQSVYQKVWGRLTNVH